MFGDVRCGTLYAYNKCFTAFLPEIYAQHKRSQGGPSGP